MSETYHLCCRTCEEHIWIGQGHASTLYFYSGDPTTVSAFNIFLRRHLSPTSTNYNEIDGYYLKGDEHYHELVFLETQQVPEDWLEVQNVYKDDWKEEGYITYDMSQPLGVKQ